MRRRAIETFLLVFFLVICVSAFTVSGHKFVYEIRVVSISFLGGYFTKSLFFYHPHI